VRTELARLNAEPRHRSSRSTLMRLAAHPLHLEFGPRVPELHIDRIGLAAGARLSKMAGADRARAISETAADSARRCGLRSLRARPEAERREWERLGPVLALLSLERWTIAERRALAGLIQARSAPSERDYAREFRKHVTLQRALAALR
jgi:hypothetical protein